MMCLLDRFVPFPTSRVGFYGSTKALAKEFREGRQNLRVFATRWMAHAQAQGIIAAGNNAM